MNDIIEIISAIKEINTNRSEYELLNLPLYVLTDGFSFYVSYCGVEIITSNDDKRYFDDVKNEYEMWKNCISRCMFNHIDEMGKKIFDE
jgi:hypothetical protein